jgi:hypothetical protein
MIMSHVVVSEEQARLLGEGKTVEVRDKQGNLLGHFTPIGFTPEEIAAAKQAARAKGPWLTTKQVQNHLKILEEALEREGSLDPARVREILAEARTRDSA